MANDDSGFAQFAMDFGKLSMNEKSWEAAQKTLIDNFLSLDSPTLTRKMFGFMNRPKHIALLIGTVTRRKDGTSVEIVEENKPASMEKGEVMTIKWKRETNEYPQGEEAFVHQSENLSRDDPDELADMKRSYTVMSVLCGLTHRAVPGAPMESFHASQKQVEDPSGLCLEFSRSVGPALVAYLFDGFHPSSKGSLYHVCKILDILLRYHSEPILQSLMANKKAFKTSIDAMLQYVHYPCVSDILLMLMCPVARSQKDVQSRFYTPTQDTRNQYLRTLAGMNLPLTIAEHIWMENAPEAHKAAAAELLQNLVESYAGLPGASEILSSLVRSPDVLDGLISVSCGEEEDFRKKKASSGSASVDEWLAPPSSGGSKKKSGGGKKKGGKSGKGKGKAKKGKGSNVNDDDDDGEDLEGDEMATPTQTIKRHTLQRDAALDTLRLIIDLSTKKQVMKTEPGIYTTFAESMNNMVECQLTHISERLHNLLDTNFDTLCRAMADPSVFQSEDLGSDVKHSIYVVKQPFSSYRLELFKLLIACVTHKPKSLLAKLDNRFWQSMTNWFFQYPHCNMYHCEFKELFLTLLRTENASHPSLLRVLDQCGFLQSMIDHFSTDSKKQRENISGHILMMCNAIRLMAQAVEPFHPLNEYLSKSQAWQEFLPDLEKETSKLTEPWPASSGAALTASNATLQRMKEVEVSKLVDPQENARATGIDLGSEFADGLGFEGVERFDESSNAGAHSSSHKRGARKSRR